MYAKKCTSLFLTETSLKMVICKSIHFPARHESTGLWFLNSAVKTHYTIPSPADRHHGGCSVLAAVNRATVSMDAQAFPEHADFDSFHWVTMSGIAWSHGHFSFSF